MIKFHDVSKIYHARGLTRRVFSGLTFDIKPGQSLAICGANGAGKSTLLRLIGGVEFPTAGHIERQMKTSWPIGFGSCFQGSMTGADNARFIARIYRHDEQEVLDYVEDFARLGAYLNQPVSTYSSGMISRLALAFRLPLILIAISWTRLPRQATCVFASAVRKNSCYGVTTAR
jgi:capsular polysaccharide transport system ATP-binding protein